MRMAEYVTPSEVRRVCKELGIRDWSRLRKPRVTMAEAKKVLGQLDAGAVEVEPEEFRTGLEVELEHGTMFPQYNVTGNHPVLTGKIVMAHFMEMPEYYQRLEVAELEGDILKAHVAGDIVKARKYSRRAARAREALARAEGRQLRNK